MKQVTKLILLLLLVVVSSCSTEPIEMKLTNPQLGVDIIGDKFMLVVDGNMDKAPFAPSTIHIKFNPKANTLFIDDFQYQVIESNHYIIKFLTGNDEIYVIEFNTGYVWQDGSTSTKFDIYEYNNKQKEYIVYTYKN